MTDDVDKAVTDLAKLLERYGENHWSSKARTALRQSQTTSKVSQIRSWFGGMGSLNDLILCEINGHSVKPDEYNLVNDQLESARAQLLSVVQRASERTK